MKRDVIFVLKAIVGVIAAFYIGAMIGFFPFFADDLIAREIGFCTLIICTVLVICTRMILNAINKGKDPETKKAGEPDPTKE